MLKMLKEYVESEACERGDKELEAMVVEAKAIYERLGISEWFEQFAFRAWDTQVLGVVRERHVSIYFGVEARLGREFKEVIIQVWYRDFNNNRPADYTLTTITTDGKLQDEDKTWVLEAIYRIHRYGR